MSGYIEFDEEYFYEMCDRKRKAEERNDAQD